MSEHVHDWSPWRWTIGKEATLWIQGGRTVAGTTFWDMESRTCATCPATETRNERQRFPEPPARRPSWIARIMNRTRR